ncbi:MAG: hypothetical protein OXB84_03290 [Halobacteriovoraceae bacterium]|nr:hypothetical protein [Halobacteriovoraceae bacterium]
MKTKIQKKYIDNGLGFTVILINVPMINVRNQWVLHINYNRYQEVVLNSLAYKPVKLTGSKIQFIRKYFQMTVRDFAKRFSVKHPAVIKWEKKKDKFTKMDWATEKDIRLFIVDELSKKASELYKLYKILVREAKESKEPIKLSANAISA